MKTLGTVVCLLAGALVAVGGVQAAATDGCKKLHATGVGQDLGGGNTVAAITHAGFLNGTTHAHFDVTGGAPPVVAIAGTIVLTAKHGTLTVGVQGTLDLSTGAFDTSGPVSSGTGKLAGTTGTLRFTGVEDLTTGAFDETITGTVCGADDD